MLQTESRLCPTILSSLPGTDSYPVAVLRRQLQHRASMLRSCEFLFSIIVVSRWYHGTHDIVRSHRVKIVACRFCEQNFVSIIALFSAITSALWLLLGNLWKSRMFGIYAPFRWIDWYNTKMQRAGYINNPQVIRLLSFLHFNAAMSNEYYKT